MLQYPISCEVRKWSVYVHVNKINGKKYVGLCNKTPSHRWGNNGSNYKHTKHFEAAIKKYGWDNFEHIILADQLTKIEASDLEIMLIAAWKTQNQKFGYNFQSGGYRGNIGIPFSEESKNKLREALAFKCKKVVCLNTRVVYPSMNYATQQLDISGNGSDISLACQNITQFCGKDKNGTPLIWVYYDDYIKMTEEDIQCRLSKMILYTTSRPLICLNTKEIFSSAEAASAYCGSATSGITRCCQSHNRIQTGHIRKHSGRHPETKEWLAWMYLDDYEKLTDEEKEEKCNLNKMSGDSVWYRKLICLNSLEVLDSVKQMTEVTTVKTAGNVRTACNDVNRTSGKHLITNEKLHWMYYDEYIQLSQIEKDDLKSRFYTGNSLFKEEPV